MSSTALSVTVAPFSQTPTHRRAIMPPQVLEMWKEAILFNQLIRANASILAVATLANTVVVGTPPSFTQIPPFQSIAVSVLLPITCTWAASTMYPQGPCISQSRRQILQLALHTAASLDMHLLTALDPIPIPVRHVAVDRRSKQDFRLTKVTATSIVMGLQER